MQFLLEHPNKSVTEVIHSVQEFVYKPLLQRKEFPTKEAASMTLSMTIYFSDLNKIPFANLISHLPILKIWQNIFGVFSYNILGIPVAAGILYPSLRFMINHLISGVEMA